LSRDFTGAAKNLSSLLTDWQARVMLFPADQPVEHDLTSIVGDIFRVTPDSKGQA